MKIKNASAMVWDQPTGIRALVQIELDESLDLLKLNTSEREALRKSVRKRIEAALKGLIV